MRYVIETRLYSQLILIRFEAKSISLGRTARRKTLGTHKARQAKDVACR